MDLELPSLNFHQMCWAREDKWGDRTVLVSNNKTPTIKTCEMMIIYSPD